MTVKPLRPKQLVEGLLVPLATKQLKDSFDRNLIIRLKQFDVPVAVQGQARWVMTRCRQCANLYLLEDGTITTSYTDPEEGEIDLQLFKFGLYALRPIEEGEPLRWHVGTHDIQCDRHLDLKTQAEIAQDPDLRIPHHDCYKDFIAEHTFSPAVQLLRPLIHGILVEQDSRLDKEDKERVIRFGDQKYILNIAATEARTRCRSCANTAIWTKVAHRYESSIQLELVTTRKVYKGEAIRWWIPDACGDEDVCSDHMTKNG